MPAAGCGLSAVGCPKGCGDWALTMAPRAAAMLTAIIDGRVVARD
jgi:hypothetical protein